MTAEPEGLLTRVVAWLRAGYPEGIPATDYPPLLAVLSRRLTHEEVESIAADLVAASDDPSSVNIEDIRAFIGEHLLDEAHPEDVARVSARLAAGGWPLGRPDEPEAARAEPTGERARPLERIVSWLREGYPQGVPPQDYFPLLALLRRRLSDDEIKAVAKSLRKAEVSPVTPADIGVEITRVTQELPSDEDLERVRARLEKKGWPLDFPERAQQG
ncbi:hypothetical protein JNB_16594 [Janibacter sp. HTCC2649]|uniref:DUF3349 domain-containing protein n=1 Tax=Janibacter sp. HTCC2649 TaxID=313589 RepID=UPI00006711BE|nr:DUF3349 domain-containing protein [Janibacter sp. HTCC2649]EAP97122.1 hypothetical protein JNB_16594 [Janibacter sp. HTCC2649]